MPFVPVNKHVDVDSLPVDERGTIGKVRLVVDGDGDPMEVMGSAGALVVALASAEYNNTIGRVNAVNDSSIILDQGHELLPKFATIVASSSGNNTIVAAVDDCKIRVLALTLSASGAVNAKFQSAAGGTDKTGLFYLAANGSIVLPLNEYGWFETAASALLNLNLSGAVAVGGCLTYIEVP